MTHMIMLAGAPDSSKLDWNEKTLLPVEHVESAAISPPSPVTSKTDIPKWRKLEMERLRMRPALPKLNINSPSTKNLDIYSPAEFLSTRDFILQELGGQSPGSDVSAQDSRPSQDSTEPETDGLAEFYDHSFSIHEAIPSSQLSESASYTPSTPMYESSDDMFSMSSNSPGIIRSPSQRRLSQAPRPRHLMDLKDIPNAAHLDAIHPQTMTVNLVVGIISIAPARTVMTGRKYGRPKETELVEMTVADDTKTAFSITMWLPREMRVNWRDGAQVKPEGARSLLRRSLKTLRPRDVIMIQNLALSSFRGKVHGQSLRGDVTKIDLMFRKKIEEDDLCGCYTVQNLRMATGKDGQIMKVKRVRDWLANSVGEAPGKGRKRLDRGTDFAGSRILPQDTQ